MVSNRPPTLETAQQLDQQDPLRNFREEFLLPHVDGRTDTYLIGNSLGLQPRRTRDYLHEVLDSWQERGVRGHFEGDHSWMDYHLPLSEPMARLVGGQPDEVVIMNTLTVNLHLMMATFYRPQGRRTKILIEQHAFPSDKNAVESRIRLHDLDPATELIELAPDDQQQFSSEQILQAIEDQHEELALILLPGVQYYTGQVLDMPTIVAQANLYEIPIGLDLAHAAGNVPLELHDWHVDFACWCTYKYLNSGPGSLAGCFIHRRHVQNPALPRMAGWWGHNASTRFEMRGDFDPILTADGWQLSNPPILSLAAIRASLDVFTEAGGMQPLRDKARRQGEFFRRCLQARLGDQVSAITPAEDSGCQLSLEIRKPGVDGRSIYELLEQRGVRTDWRYPNVIRAAPVPLYNRFEDIWQFVDILGDCLNSK